ncbi:MAG: hypothetical protein HY077_03020 [Elusimicrobia bacterium]|nr:hypothetical protein [Elusimicrobiota bacterium]
MGKKTKGPREAIAQSPALESLSARGKKVIAIGAAILVFGFFAISFTDPMGRNWASVLAPFLILGGYVLIGGGIFVPDEGSVAEQSQDLS